MRIRMTKLFSVIAGGLLACGTVACTSTSPPVAPSETPGSVIPLVGSSPTNLKPDHAAAAKPGDMTIVEIVLQPDDEFDVLQAAVIRAGLVDALNGNRQVTVFAPTDAAFVATLGVVDEAAAVAAVSALDVETLTDILLYHVTHGRRTSNSVLAAPRYQMLNGDTLTRADLLTAGIAATDVSAINGIVHVIDSVLLP